MNEKSAPTEAVSEPVPSPRPAEEIRADLARAADGSLDAIANWPALSLRLIDDVASLLADRERLSAELADARATVERVSAAWADVIQRQQRADNEHRYDVEEITGRAVAAERALEAVRAQVAAVEALIPGDGSEFAIFPFQLRAALGVTPGEYLLIPRAALSAASPTTSPEGATDE